MNPEPKQKRPRKRKPEGRAQPPKKALPKALEPPDPFLEHLAGLARLVAQRDDLRVIAGEAGCGWSYQPSGSLITADSRDLRVRSADWNRGLILHESAHAAVTCYHDILPESWSRDPLVLVLLNAIEDCRIETWLSQRFPGAAQWIHDYNRVLFGELLTENTESNLVGQFLSGMMVRWFQGHLPPNLDARVVRALEASSEGIDHAIGCQPPMSLEESPRLREAWKHLPCARIWEGADHNHPPSSFRIHARLSQFAMWSAVHRDVWPHVQALRQQDRKSESWIRDLLKQLEAAGFKGLKGNGTQGQSGGQTISVHIEARGNPANRETLANILDPGGLEPYHQIRAPLQPAIENLGDLLMELTCRMGRHRPRTGYPSGTRLDWNAVQSWEADPRRWDRLWIRSDRPRPPTPCLSILVDLSGSMEGDKSFEARKGVVLVAEACRRAGIPLEFWTFAAKCQQILEYDTPLNDQVRSRIVSIPQACNGGTNMASALRELSAHLPSLPCSDHFVVLVGDGEPTDGHDMPAALRALAQAGVQVTGIGIGESSKGLVNWFPDAIVGVDPMEIGSRLGQLIQTRLGDSIQA